MDVAFVAPVVNAATQAPVQSPLATPGAPAQPNGSFSTKAAMALGALAACSLATKRTARRAQEMATLPKHMQPVDPA
eukprot:g16294.t1